MSLIGVGLDLIELSRFRSLYDLNDIDVLARVFTSAEMAEAHSGINAIERLAGRFVAKEATLKVLGGLQQGTAFTDIEVHSKSGRPLLFLKGEAAKRAEALAVKFWHVSITHSENSAAAVVIATS